MGPRFVKTVERHSILALHMSRQLLVIWAYSPKSCPLAVP